MSKIATKRVNRTEYFKHYSEAEIRELIIADLKEKAGIDYPAIVDRFLLSTKDAVGHVGREHYAELSLHVDHESLAAPAEEG